MTTAEAIVRPDVTARTGVDVRGVVTRPDSKQPESKRPEPKRPEQARVEAEAATEFLAFTGEDRYRMIAEAAYFRAERRGFAGGSDLDDWLAAEMEIDQILGVVEPLVDA